MNTAEDFISFYEQMTPLVQTLPLILLHKETIFSELISRLQVSARLSLEPILRYVSLFAANPFGNLVYFFGLFYFPRVDFKPFLIHTM